MVWAVNTLSVEVPEGAETVLMGTRDYYRHLARARWVVSNDAMPTHYVKREGTRYGQTWHGTPLKRIGFDIDNLQMSNKNYLRQFGKDVAKWDALVSPNPFSTDILASALPLPRRHPRDRLPAQRHLLPAELGEQRRKSVRHRLGIAEDKRVILYARHGGTTTTTTPAATSSR